MKIQFSRIKNIELIFLNSSNETYEIIQFEIKLKWEERCKCTEFHLPPLSRKLLTRNIPKDGYFFLPLPTYVFLKSVPNTIPTGPDSAATSLKETCFRRTQHISWCSLCGGGGSYERKWNFFLFATQRYNRISTWRRRKWKLSGHVSPPPFYHIAQIETLLR